MGLEFRVFGFRFSGLGFWGFTVLGFRFVGLRVLGFREVRMVHLKWCIELYRGYGPIYGDYVGVCGSRVRA